jgi:hypothetical protein
MSKSSNLILLIRTLDALGVVVVLLGACSSASTSSSARVSLTTALSVLLRSNSTSTRASSRSFSRLSNGSHGAGLDSSSGRSSGLGRSSGSSRLSGAAGSTGPDCRSNTRVGGSTTVDVEHDTSLGLLVGAGEADAGGESGGAGAADLDVHALHVELGALGFGALVQSEDFGTEDVLAGSKASGDLGVMLVQVLRKAWEHGMLGLPSSCAVP